ncbi:MAG: hypothetical protein ACXIVF_17055 [Rhizobiaceae bacterium]
MDGPSVYGVIENALSAHNASTYKQACMKRPKASSDPSASSREQQHSGKDAAMC